MQSSDLYDAIDRLGATAIAFCVYRQVSETRDCLSGEGARRFGGRWNPPDSYPTIYTSLSLAGAKAELERLMRRQGRRLEDLLPRRVCEIDVRLGSVLDLRGRRALQAVGLAANSVRGDDLTACQLVGQAAHQLGFEGILAPSATRVAGNLAIFELNVLADSAVEVSRSYVWSASRDPGQ